MKLSRLRSGELVAAAGALALVVLTFLPWYRSSTGSLSAWDDFGVMDVVILAAIVAAGALILATVTERTPALPVASAIWATLASMLGVLAILVGLVSLPDHAVGLRAGSWLGLAAALAILAGSWQSLRDERTSCYPLAEPEPRRPRV